MIQPRPTNHDIGPIVLSLFRISILLIFVVVVLRLFQLQVVGGEQWQQRADENRYESFEVRPLRGIIYDRKNVILVRNRPSFQIGLIPEYVIQDDDTTENVDEEVVMLIDVLRLLRADKDRDITVRIQELLFRRLGQRDYRAQLENETVGIQVSTISVPDPSTPNIPVDVQRVLPEILRNTPALSSSLVISGVTIPLITIPDTSVPLPIEGLAVLVKRLIELRRQGAASVPEPILDLVDTTQAAEIVDQSYRIRALRVEQDPVREYVYGPEMSHVLGFMGPIPASQFSRNDETDVPYKPSRGYLNPNERVGLSGLEYSYQDQLRGIPGFRQVQVDILGREVNTVRSRDPVPGQNLVLGIDLLLQRSMIQYLQEAIDEKSAKWGVAIAMDPMTGLIKGMVSLPSFDNNIFSKGIGKEYFALADDERKPLINYAIGGLYPPGSTFKLVTATGAIQEGIIGPTETVNDAGPLYLPNKFFPNDPTQGQVFVSWNHKLGINYGPINVVQALALSNDIYFYWIGGGYPPNDIPGLNDTLMEKWSLLYGYGRVTGIDLPAEVTSFIPDDRWKRETLAETWTTGDSYNMSIGQGYMLSTPLQVLVSAAAVANGGKVMQPQIVYQITDANGGLQRNFEPKVVRELPVSPENLRYIQEGMWSAVNAPAGTAIASQIAGITVAGKTGTAEYCDYQPEKFPDTDGCRRDDKDNLPTHAWYVAYAPYEAPEIAIVVFVYDGGEGSGTALPVARRTMETYFSQISPRAASSGQ